MLSVSIATYKLQDTQIQLHSVSKMVFQQQLDVQKMVVKLYELLM